MNILLVGKTPSVIADVLDQVDALTISWKIRIWTG
jgi:hypothetical protein